MALRAGGGGGAHQIKSNQIKSDFYGLKYFKYKKKPDLMVFH